jgi:translation initiation factor IF-1
MARADAIEVEGTVIEILPHMLYRVELANGHRVLAHFKRRSQSKTAAFAAGEKVMLEMSPFDLSTGRIICNEK